MPSSHKPTYGDRPPTAVLYQNDCTDCGHRWQDYGGCWATILVKINDIWQAACPNCHSLYWTAKPLDKPSAPT